jgi:tRNA G26 N,N-dimethylase Trm1
MPVLAGVQADACEQRYGARPVRGRLGPEGGLRILLAWLARGAASRDRSIHSLLAYVHDHHVRCYVTVASPAGPAPLATVTNSGLPFPVLPGPGPYGPMWVGPLLDAPFVRRLSVPHGAEHARELSGWLARFREESEVDVPFYFEPNTIARALGLPRPPPLEALIQGLRARGFRAGRSPVRPSAFRTDAPRAVLEEVARAAVPAGIGGTGPARPTGPTPSGGS